MMFQKTSLGLIFLFLSMIAHAGTMGSIPKDYFFSVSGGPSWTSAGERNNIELQPGIIKSYAPNNLSNPNFLGNGEIFSGIQRSFFAQVSSQFGLAVYASSFAKLNGFILEDGDINFRNYYTQYKVDHWHIALKSKWIGENPYNINPYLSGSIGVGFNYSYGYIASPLIIQEINAPPFSANRRVAFSCSLGAGFQHTVNKHFSAGLGYQFVSWGSSSLGTAPGQTTGTGLSLSNLYTHGIEFNVSYFL